MALWLNTIGSDTAHATDAAQTLVPIAAQEYWIVMTNVFISGSHYYPDVFDPCRWATDKVTISYPQDSVMIYRSLTLHWLNRLYALGEDLSPMREEPHSLTTNR